MTNKHDSTRFVTLNMTGVKEPVKIYLHLHPDVAKALTDELQKPSPYGTTYVVPDTKGALHQIRMDLVLVCTVEPFRPDRERK